MCIVIIFREQHDVAFSTTRKTPRSIRTLEKFSFHPNSISLRIQNVQFFLLFWCNGVRLAGPTQRTFETGKGFGYTHVLSKRMNLMFGLLGHDERTLLANGVRASSQTIMRARFKANRTFHFLFYTHVLFHSLINHFNF